MKRIGNGITTGATNTPGECEMRGAARPVVPAYSRTAIARTLRLLVASALALALMLGGDPQVVYADSGLHAGASASSHAVADDLGAKEGREPQGLVAGLTMQTIAQVKGAVARLEAEREQAAQATDKLLAYDAALIAQIGTQERTGHTICCPSFSCAYADAVMDGTVHDHSYYTCSCCSWTDWGGGDSSFRRVGTDEQLLREAYDQIRAGKPTVIHVAASYGEHWIALIGYQGAADPDHLSLSNFIALDPWDGAQIEAGARFALYGDGCEHVSSR